MNKYSYLKDKDFLKKIDESTHKEQFLRIFVLDFTTENILASIEGKCTGGSCSLNGASAMRRSANCSLVADPAGIKIQGYEKPQEYSNITEVSNLISMNKKIKIETGFYNSFKELGYYSNNDIIWFPLGTYVIKAASVSHNNSGINISLTLNDKCSLLNGDMGGVIPAGTVFSEQEIYNFNGTERQVKKILLKDIIKNLVVEFGGEKIENVFITDIDDTIVKVVKWTGSENLYLYQEKDNGSLQFSTTKPEGIEAISEFSFGDNVGYMNEPFVYPGTLECKAGETVSSILDKIKNILGNFEWFYDIDGRFIFQKKKDYINDSVAKEFLSLTENDYLSVSNHTSPTYIFDNKKIITSISNSPQYQNIKNDFIVWGTAKTASGADKPIHYHLVFAKKPDVDVNKQRFCLVYNDYRDLTQAIVLKEKQNYEILSQVPSLAQEKEKYYIVKNKDHNNEVFAWDEERNIFRHYPNYEVCFLITEDWRTELYFQGLEKDNKTFSSNPYSAELNAEWPKLYNVKQTLVNINEDGFAIYKGGMREGLALSNYDYWIDFLEGADGGSQSISQFSINNIGRRAKVVTDNNSNCIFPTEVPNYILIEADGDTQEDLALAEEKGQEVIQVYPEIFSHLSIGGSQNSAYEKIKELLYTHTCYNESVSLSVVPIYYLEPNTKIFIEDNKLGIFGNYLIKSISLPLTTNSTSNISCIKCLEKTI